MTARLAVKLTPGAASDRIDGWDVDADDRAILKVRVRARPVEGEANKSLLLLLAKSLGVPKSAVTPAARVTSSRAREASCSSQPEVR